MALQSRSPQRPDDLVVEVEEADAEAVAGAVERARTAAGRWAAAPALERSSALAEAADALAGAAGEVTGLMVREVGKPVTEACATTPSRPSTRTARPIPAPARPGCCWPGGGPAGWPG